MVVGTSETSILRHVRYFTPSIVYLNDLVYTVRGARLRGDTLEEAMSGNELPAAYVIPADSPFAVLGDFFIAVHRWNLRVTYSELAGG